MAQPRLPSSACISVAVIQLWSMNLIYLMRWDEVQIRLSDQSSCAYLCCCFILLLFYVVVLFVPGIQPQFHLRKKYLNLTSDLNWLLPAKTKRLTFVRYSSTTQICTRCQRFQCNNPFITRSLCTSSRRVSHPPLPPLLLHMWPRKTHASHIRRNQLGLQSVSFAYTTCSH